MNIEPSKLPTTTTSDIYLWTRKGNSTTASGIATIGKGVVMTLSAAPPVRDVLKDPKPGDRFEFFVQGVGWQERVVGDDLRVHVGPHDSYEVNSYAYPHNLVRNFLPFRETPPQTPPVSATALTAKDQQIISLWREYGNDTYHDLFPIIDRLDAEVVRLNGDWENERKAGDALLRGRYNALVQIKVLGNDLVMVNAELTSLRAAVAVVADRILHDEFTIGDVRHALSKALEK